jgi:Secretion system C-terminal sorting domain
MKINIILGLICFTPLLVEAQTVLASEGNFVKLSAFQISYTVGEIVLNSGSLFGSDITLLTGGFQQPENVGYVAVVDIEGLKIDVKLYPNPMQESLNIELKGDLNTRLIFTLTDLSGRRLLIRNLELGQKTLVIPTNELSNGIYLLEIRHSEKGVLKSFQIAKAQ